MTRREQRELVQRWFDGEALGAEDHIASRLVADDPDARGWLEMMEGLADGVREDVQSAVEQEDFSGYWGAIADRLPEGPVTLEREADVLRVPPTEIKRRRRGLAWLLRPAAALTVALLAALLLQIAPTSTPPSYVVEIIEVESGGAVVVQEATLDSPSMVSFVESAG